MALEAAQEAICRFLATGGVDKNGLPIQKPAAFLKRTAYNVANDLIGGLVEARKHEPYDEEPGEEGETISAGAREAAARPFYEDAYDCAKVFPEVANDEENYYLLVWAEHCDYDDVVAERGSSKGAARVHVCKRRAALRKRFPAYVHGHAA